MQNYFPRHLAPKALYCASLPRHLAPKGSLSNPSSLSYLDPKPYTMYHTSKASALQYGHGISPRTLLFAFPLRLVPIPREQPQNVAERYAGQTPQKMTIFLPSPMQSYFLASLTSNLKHISCTMNLKLYLYSADQVSLSGYFSMLFHSVCSQCREGSPKTWPKGTQARHPKK